MYSDISYYIKKLGLVVIGSNPFITGLLKLRRYGGTEVSLKRQKLEMRRGSLLLLRPRVYLNALLSSASL